MVIPSLLFDRCLLHQRTSVLFLLQCRFSTVILVVPPVPGDSDQGKQCLFCIIAVALPSCHNATFIYAAKMEYSEALWGTSLHTDGVIFFHFAISIYLRMITESNKTASVCQFKCKIVRHLPPLLSR